MATSTALEFFRIETGICPADRNDRNINIGEDVRGRAQMTTGAAMRINSGENDNVYGRLRASLTIHIESFCAPVCRDRP